MHRFSSSAQAVRSLMSLTAVLSLSTLLPDHTAHAADSTAETPQVTLGNDGNSKSLFRTLFDGQRAIGTGGMTSLEGSSGGGLATWATISGYGSDKSAGMAFHYSYVNVTNYWDQNVGASIGLFDRVELSYTHNFFQTRATGAKLGIGNGYQFDLDVAGAKVRLFGHVADNTLIPQVAIGAMYKHDSDGRIIHMVGSKHTDGADAYLAVTKLFPKIGILIDTTVRFTKANQWGIIGFGGDLDNNYHAQFEGSLGYLPPFLPGLIVGVEYRTKPRNQRFTDESNWFDVYTSYFINKHLNITLAYVSLGTIATFKNQTGFYFSAQTGF